ncbi:hypothetical protein SESBI_10142 [Sesbania bispinosa]|nr:hypothetical protein SESBI_10142 [Sesbania bispinosa]
MVEVNKKCEGPPGGYIQWRRLFCEATRLCHDTRWVWMVVVIRREAKNGVGCEMKETEAEIGLYGCDF